MQLVTAPATLKAVIGELELAADPDFASHTGVLDGLLSLLHLSPSPAGGESEAGVMEHLRRAVTVERRDLTYLISIGAQSRDPNQAAAIANALASAYINRQIDSKVVAALSARNIVDGRIGDAAKALADSEGAFDRFIEVNLSTLISQTGRSDLASLHDQIVEARTAQSQSSGTADTLAQHLASRDWPTLAHELQSGGSVQVAIANVSVSDAADVPGSELEETAKAAINDLRQQAANAQAQEADARARLRGTILAGDLPADTLTSIYELQQNSQIARSQYQALLQRSKDLEAQAYLQVADSRLVAEALPPTRPSFPNPPVLLSLAGIAGLGLGIGMAFLAEMVVGGFSSEDQLQSVLRAGPIATIPRVRPAKDSPAGMVTVADLLVEAPLSAYAEAIRRLRLMVDQTLRKQAPVSGARVIMVSSARPDEGKSSTALALARAYALSGRKTLVIDCDLRHPALHVQLGLDPSTGLFDYLAEADESPPLPSIVSSDPMSGAKAILGARASEVATDQLLAGSTFGRLIAAARETFDVVIIDTPPIDPIVDGLYLVPLADLVVLVVRWASTSQQTVRSTLASLERARTNSTGLVAVLNRQETWRNGGDRAYVRYGADS